MTSKELLRVIEQTVVHIHIEQGTLSAETRGARGVTGRGSDAPPPAWLGGERGGWASLPPSRPGLVQTEQQWVEHYVSWGLFYLNFLVSLAPHHGAQVGWI